MKRGRPDLANLMVFGAALAVVVIGVMMAFTHAPTAPPAIQARQPQPAPQSFQPHLRTSQLLAAARPHGAANVAAPHAVAALPEPPTAHPRPQIAPKRAVSPSASAPSQQRRFATRQDGAGKGPVPPLLPPLYGPQLTSVPARPPDVLRLTGIVEGQERLAIMRRGGNRYMARLGDAVDNQRVVQISADSVVLQRGARKRTLRLSR